MKYGLIGEHLPHSFSKEIHGMLADYEYDLCELTPCEVESFMLEKDFLAINVTIPYKQTVIPFLEEIDDHARAIGAVNTIVNKSGKLYGYNTDFYGLSELIRRTGISLEGKKVLILGTGGTCRTSLAVAKHMGASEIIVAGRSARDGVITYDEMDQLHTDAEIIINTTPCGMFPYADGSEKISATPVDISRFPRLCGVIDAVYNPLRTNLVLDARARGIPANGVLYMLVAQAVRACEIFTEKSIHDSELDRVFAATVSDKENIVLTGMPGSEKTTIGHELSQLLGRPMIDTDAEIAKKTGMAITDIFANMGEKAFRDIESEVIKEVASSAGCIISTGGGAILRDQNIRALSRNGRIYFLNRPLEQLIPTQDRPIASSVEALKKRFTERYERYLSTCDIEIRNDGELADAISAITSDFFKETNNGQKAK